MKKHFLLKIACATGCVVLPVVFGSCIFGANRKDLVVPGELQEVYYEEGINMYEVNAETSTFVLKNLPANKLVTVAKTNVSNSYIYSGNTQWVSDVALYGNDGNGRSLVSSNESVLNLQETNFVGSDFVENEEEIAFHYTAPVYDEETLRENIVFDGSRSVNGDYKKNVEVPQLELKVGKTEKYIYVDTKFTNDVDGFKLAKSILRASGDYCNIWVVDGYFESDGDSARDYYEMLYENDNPKPVVKEESAYKIESSLKVSQEYINQLCSTFDRIYPMARSIFGEESDKINYGYNYYTGFSQADMNFLSDTGTKVNIVIYDIGYDAAESVNKNNIVGYFHSKDYHPNGYHFITLTNYYYSEKMKVLKYSNEGKYFYLDASYCKQDPVLVTSTLAHEFQHMINYGQKVMTGIGFSDVWYNEMLSQLCEDVLATKIQPVNFNIMKTPYNRFEKFVTMYGNAGLSDESANSYIANYGTNYAFGAWLIRNHGGLNLVHNLSSGNRNNIAAIEDYTGLSMEQLLMEYVYDCSVANKGRGFLKGFDEEYDNNVYNILSLNIFTGFMNNGPGYYYGNQTISLYPYGFMLCVLGDKFPVTGGNLVINLGNKTGVSKNERFYIVVRDVN